MTDTPRNMLPGLDGYLLLPAPRTLQVVWLIVSAIVALVFMYPSHRRVPVPRAMFVAAWVTSCGAAAFAAFLAFR